MSFAGALRLPGQPYAANNLNAFPDPNDFDKPQDPQWNYVGTLDNDSTNTQLHFLAKVSGKTPGKDGDAYRAALKKRGAPAQPKPEFAGDAVVGIQRQEDGAVRFANATVARLRQPAIVLIDDAISRPPQAPEYLERVPILGAVVDGDQLVGD